MAKTIHVSSNATLFLKLFFPVFWLVFWGVTAIAFWFSKEAYVGGMSIYLFRLLITSFVLTGGIVFYFTTFQLRRVDVDADFFYVTNYKKTARYPYHNIEKLEEKNYFFFKIFHLYFRTPGIFGKKLLFLSSRHRFDTARQMYPEINAMIIKDA